MTYVQGDLSGHDAEDMLLKLGIHVLSLLCLFVTLCTCAERRQARWLLLARAGSEGLVGGAGGAAGGVGRVGGWGHRGDPPPKRRIWFLRDQEG